MQLLLQTWGVGMHFRYQSYRCYWTYLNMPLPSVLIHGAMQCKAITKRSKKRCLNPAAYGCSTCRYHGATPVHTRKSLSGKDHHQQSSTRLRFLEDLGHHIKMFHGNATRTRGRKANGYLKLNLSDPIQLIIAILKTMEEK